MTSAHIRKYLKFAVIAIGMVWVFLVFRVTHVVALTLSEPTVSDITSTSVKINWTTDENATSVVFYDDTETESFEFSATDLTLTTSHSVTLSGLTANTTYYYYAESDALGNVTDSIESTFVSAAAEDTPTPTSTPVPGSTSTTTTTTTAKATPTPTPKPTDKTAPNVLIDFDFSKPFREAPKITGKATDTGAVNPGVAKVEYSTDDGKNWIPVDELKGKGEAGRVKDRLRSRLNLRLLFLRMGIIKLKLGLRI